MLSISLILSFEKIVTLNNLLMLNYIMSHRQSALNEAAPVHQNILYSDLVIFLIKKHVYAEQTKVQSNMSVKGIDIEFAMSQYAEIVVSNGAKIIQNNFTRVELLYIALQICNLYMP